ncbi:hypothetical protein J4E05_18825 [Thalassospira sp. NFXS8]|uniref:carbamoyltransferase C-terminal domain-containing protein n=1 Tax=Thalassospira sp. NFXS8 TaxID=2819093 RepID=UPI0032E02459
MKDGYFLSIYAHICSIAAMYSIPRRHDQAMALWCRSGESLVLCRYWEFERLTGIKGHALSFPDENSAYEFIAEALLSENLTLNDLNEIIGTPGLSAPTQINNTDYNLDLPVAYHSLCHIYSGLLTDSDVFYEQNILCLSMDAGPDHVIDYDSWAKPHYVGALACQGSVTLFSVQSPALFWAIMREKSGLAEGSLMALGGASLVRIDLPFPPAPAIRSVEDRFAASDWIDEIMSIIEQAAEYDPEKFYCPQGKFSLAENKIALLVKVIQETSFNMVANEVELALKKFNIAADNMYLSMVGGFALNCPINAKLLKKFGFKGLVAPPVVNDSGIALGMGLYHVAKSSDFFRFKIETAFHGRKHEISEQRIKSSMFADWVLKVEDLVISQVVDDIICGPIIWFDGAAEIGPRALGHRSLLADPRNRVHKERLNLIKQREWWRPVAPIVLAESAKDWFELIGGSPFMLQAVAIHKEFADRISAVSHLDGSARVQTLEVFDDLLLSSIIREFSNKTGVPILCNTSLNDKNEPIIDDPLRAIEFALEKGVEVVYLNGKRIQLAKLEAKNVFRRVHVRLARKYFTPPPMTEDWMEKYNPHRISQKELTFYFSNPRFFKFDLTEMKDVEHFRRLVRVSRSRRGDDLDTMMAPSGMRDGGLVVD